MLDFVMAIIIFVLGYVFFRRVLFSWQGWSVTAFTTAYLLTVTVYLIKKGVFVKRSSVWFWMTITFLTGASYSIGSNPGFSGIRGLFLFGSAVYFVIIASGRTLLGKTSNYLFLDGLNALIILPFRNFLNHCVSFSVLGKGAKRGKILPVTLGIAIATILMVILIPLLERADSGGFGIILQFFSFNFWEQLGDIIFYIIVSAPIAAYIYGLVSGVAHGKGTNIIKRESADKTVCALRFLHPATVFVVLSVVCALYAVFIFSQLPYFFSAFARSRPEGWLVYSEYARRGFFELCTIAVINISILTASNLTCKKQRRDSGPLRMFNIVLSAITLVLIAAAFSKMALYIEAYGLTMPRLLPCVFMVFLAMVFIALIVMCIIDARYKKSTGQNMQNSESTQEGQNMQRSEDAQGMQGIDNAQDGQNAQVQKNKSFSIVRFALITGVVILCLLSLSNPDALVVRYNADRYLSGTLREFDTEILRRAGNAGVIAAIDVYNNTNDEKLKDSITRILSSRQAANVRREDYRRDAEWHRATNAISATDIPQPSP